MGLFGRKKNVADDPMLREIMGRLEVDPTSEAAKELAAIFRGVDNSDPSSLLTAALVTLRAGLGEMTLDFVERAIRAGEVDDSVEFALIAARVGATDIALRMLETAGECGYDQSEFKIAEALLVGDRVDEATVHFTQLAADGVAGADFYLGVIAMNNEQLDLAESQFMKSIDRGETEGVLNMAEICDRRGDHDQAREWFHKAREVGDENAFFNLGTMEWTLGNEDEAIKYLSIAAEEGNERAGAQLARIRMQRGEEVDRGALERAAESGIPEAMVNLALVLRGENDYESARAWFGKAIEAGNVAAMLQLASMEAGFTDVRVMVGEREPNVDEAKRLWLMAAEAGEPAGYGYLALNAMADADDADLERFIHLGLAATPKTFSVMDVEEVAADSPDFTIPPREMRERFAAGQTVKLMWSDGEHVERMWAVILRNDEGRYVGALDNDPIRLDIRQGTLVEFGPEHIMERPPTPDEQAEAMRHLMETGERSRAIPEGVTQARYDEIKTLAEEGDVDSMHSMIEFAERNGDADMFFHWVERAAELGDARSLVLLGARAYENEEFAEAEKLFLEAIDEEPMALHLLALLAYAQREDATAEIWLRRGAEAGYVDSMSALGQVLIDRDTVEARLWLEKAVAAKNADAMLFLSRLEYADGDEDHARTLLALAAELGNESAATALDNFEDFGAAIEYRRSLFDSQTVADYESRAQAGDPESVAWLLTRASALSLDDQRIPLLEMGMSYGIDWAFGLMGDELNKKSDIAGAQRMWEEAAGRGNPDAMYKLGHLRAHEEDWAGAVDWYTQGASLGHAECMCILGEIALNEKRLDDSADLLRRAVEGDSARARFLLGVVFIQQGDREEAMKLIVHAAEAGEEDAQQFLARLSEAS